MKLTDRQRRALFAKRAATKGLPRRPRRTTTLAKAPRRRKAAFDGATLLAKHEGLVKRVAGQFHRRFPGAAFEDLLQEGRMGLLRAGELYRKRPGARFSTYAHHHIAKRIRDAAASSNTVTVNFRAFKKGARAGVDRGDEGATKIAASAGSSDGGIGRAHARATLTRLLTRLPESEATVIQLRHADGGLTHRAIAKRLGKSVSTIHSLEARALARLRRVSLRKGKRR